MNSKPSRPPAELGVEGKKLWRQIAADATSEGIELTAPELVWLRHAGLLADMITRLELEVSGAELLVSGYMGKGVVSNPLLGELRLHRQLLAQTVARINLDMPESAGVNASGGSNRFRTAALARWSPA